MQRSAAFIALLCLASAAFAADKNKPSAALPPGKITFAPFKDELFAYPKILSTNPDGSRIVVDFSAKRDLNGRDAVPLTQALPERIAPVDKAQQDLVLSDKAVTVPFVEVGDLTKPAKLAFIFVHGAGGNRFQGVDDQTFGGNFNRAKNLVTKAGGIYLSPGLTDETDKGAAEVKLLMQEFAKHSPGAPIFVACSSNGGRLCMRLLDDPASVQLLGGVFFLGAITSTGIFGTTIPKASRVPIYVGAGSADAIVSSRGGDRLYKGLKARDPTYPIHLVIFKSGKHGTPMRMIDWRTELNWMVGAPAPAVTGATTPAATNVKAPVAK
jgi:hypothetical protein